MSDCGSVKKVFVPTKVEVIEASVEAPVSGVRITDKAAEKIIHFCKTDQKDPALYGLKVAVVNDGCSGKSYTMDLASIEAAKAAGDKIFEYQGASVIVEKLSYLFVTGAILDYKETLLMSGFELKNPNIKGACSCGSSFSV